MPTNPQSTVRATRSTFALCTALLTFSFLAPVAHAQANAEAQAQAEEVAPDPKFRAAVREYLVLQKSADHMGMSVAYGAANEILMAIAQSGVEVTEPMQAIVLEQALENYGSKFGDVDFLTDLLTPIYAEHYSEPEIQSLITFFKSPIGKKSIELAGPINEAGMSAVQESAFAITPAFQLAVTSQLEAAGFNISPAP